MSIEAMKQALEALEYIDDGANNQGAHTGISWRCVSNKAQPAIISLRQAIAELESQEQWGVSAVMKPEYVAEQQKKTEELRSMLESQEPVGWIDSKGNMICTKINESCKPLYTHPQQRTWVGLTEEEILKFQDIVPNTLGYDLIQFSKAIEAKLKEKNT